jgi:hypothetical protein
MLYNNEKILLLHIKFIHIYIFPTKKAHTYIHYYLIYLITYLNFINWLIVFMYRKFVWKKKKKKIQTNLLRILIFVFPFETKPYPLSLLLFIEDTLIWKKNFNDWASQYWTILFIRFIEKIPGFNFNLSAQ